MIGKGGSKIQLVREQSGVTFASIAKCDDQAAPERILLLQGTPEQCAVAWKMFAELLVSQTESGTESKSDQVCVKILCDAARIGAVIGKGGESIKKTQADTGARVQCSNEALPGSTEKTVNITGTPNVLEQALVIVLGQLRDFPLKPGSVSTPFVPRSHAAPPAAQPIPYSPYGTPGTFPPPNPYDPYADPYAGRATGFGQGYPGVYGGQSHSAAVVRPVTSGTKHTQKLVIPTACAGGVIGKGGSRIRDIQAQSGCTCRIADATSDAPSERIVTLEGTDQGIELAISMIRQAVDACEPR